MTEESGRNEAMGPNRQSSDGPPSELRNVHGLDQPLTQSPIRERAGRTRSPHSLLADGEGDPEVLRTLLE